jgi:hypothetical protein
MRRRFARVPPSLSTVVRLRAWYNYGQIVAGEFESHVWKEVVTAETLDLYKHYVREVFVGSPAALVAIDLYELAYQGLAKPVTEINEDVPEFVRRARVERNLPYAEAVHGGARGRFADLLLYQRNTV